MTWRNSSISWPDAAGNIQQATEGVLNQVGGQMNAATGRLTETAGRANFQRNALSARSESLLGCRAELEALLVSGQVLTVTPYQYGVGRKEPNGSFLSPENAINTLVAKLRDKADDNRPQGNQYFITVMLSAETLKGFHTALANFTAVLPLPELAAITRRVQHELTWASEKMNTPAVDLVPRYKPAGYLCDPPLREALNVQGAQIGQLESMAGDRFSPVDKLQRLAAKRSARLEKWQDQINELKAVDGNIWVFKQYGSPETLASNLVQAVLPNSQHAFSIAAMFTAPQQMKFLEGLFNA